MAQWGELYKVFYRFFNEVRCAYYIYVISDLTGSVVQSVPPSGPLLGGSVPRSTILVAITGSVSLMTKYN